MVKLGTLDLKGATGRTYAFDVYASDTNWKNDFACVYYVSRRARKTGGGWEHNKIYIGQTEDLETRFANHHKQACFDQHSYNAISVHADSNEQSRIRKESDLISGLNPPCND